jgi:RNA binding exosome subunit
MGSATVYMHAEMAREREQGLLAEAAAQRDAERAQLYGRISRQAERAERRQLRQRDQAIRLRGRLEKLVSAL